MGLASTAHARRSSPSPGSNTITWLDPGQSTAPRGGASSGVPRREADGRLPAIIGRCSSVRLVAASSERDQQVRRDSGWAGEGLSGGALPAHASLAAVQPAGLCRLCSRPPPGGPGARPPPPPACHLPVRASSRAHLAGQHPSGLRVLSLSDTRDWCLYPQLISASLPVEFHLHPWACSNSPERTSGELSL